jgi:hypothetical protein
MWISTNFLLGAALQLPFARSHLLLFCTSRNLCAIPTFFSPCWCWIPSRAKRYVKEKKGHLKAKPGLCTGGGLVAETTHLGPPFWLE